MLAYGDNIICLPSGSVKSLTHSRTLSSLAAPAVESFHNVGVVSVWAEGGGVGVAQKALARDTVP